MPNEIKPTDKSPAIDQFLSDTMGKDRKETIVSMKCMTCPRKVTEAEFRDELSRREYAISGMCQVCQDSVFGGEES